MKRGIVVLAAGALATVGMLTACSAAGEPQEHTTEPTASTAETVPDDLPTTARLDYQNVAIGQGRLQVPTLWPTVMVPAADKGYMVTTAPGEQTVGITLLGAAPSEVTQTLLDQAADTVRGTGTDTSVTATVIDARQGSIVVTRNGNTTYAWLISTFHGTFLVTLGAPYTTTTSATPRPVPTAYAQGSAEDQVGDMIRHNLA